MLSFRRLYHVSSTAYSIKKLGLKLNKMVNPKVKRSWHPTHLDTDFMPSVKSLTKTQKEPGKRSIRRAAMLNKMFMKNITDLMSTGTVSMDIVGRGIEISKVKITPNLETVNVFWVCKGDSSDAETELVLNRVAGALRHELSTLRVMGEVPYIAFVKDRQEAQIVELDRRLSVADYGDDYTPTDAGQLLKSEFVLNTKLSPELQAKIRQLEDEVPPIEDPIPEMTNNVYGLDHAKIMNRLLAARKKNKDAWARLDHQDSGSTDASILKPRDDVISYSTDSAKESVDVISQRKELADFLLKRRILQNKIHKELQTAGDEWQYEYVDDDVTDDDVIDDDYDDENYYYQHDFKIDSDKIDKCIPK